MQLNHLQYRRSTILIAKAAVILWSVYYFLVFTVGTNPQYAQLILWGFLTLPAGLTVILYTRTRLIFPAEVKILAGLIVLCLVGSIFNDVHMPLFLKRLRFMVQFIIIMTSVSMVIRVAQEVRWFFVGFLAVAAYILQVSLGGFNEETIQMAEEITEGTRQTGEFSNSNYLGAVAQISLLGALALFGAVKSWIFRAASILGGAMALLTIVLSGSRGAFLPIGIYAVLYPLWAYGSKLKNKLNIVFPIIITVLVSTYLWFWISEATFLGQRLEDAASREDSSSEHRIELIFIGLDLALLNPFFGVGLGQFIIHNPLRIDAHSEWAELLGTTGFLGFILYFSMYWISWKRLQRAVKMTKDTTLRYYCNIGKIILIMLMVTGATSRQNFTLMEVWFLYGLTVGIGIWAEESAILGLKNKQLNLETDKQKT